MKIATFNINNVRKRLPNLLGWLRSDKPDIVCLQELKTPQADFPVEPIQNAGYEAVWKGEKTWNGVAVLSKIGAPVITTTSLPGNPSDHQSRYIEAAIQGILVGCLYAPNGNPQPGPKFAYKLAWLDRLAKHAAMLIKDDVPAILIGDYNIVPTPFDIYPSKSWANDALVQPESRAAYKRATGPAAPRVPRCWVISTARVCVMTHRLIRGIRRIRRADQTAAAAKPICAAPVVTDCFIASRLSRGGRSAPRHRRPSSWQRTIIPRRSRCEQVAFSANREKRDADYWPS